MLPGLTADDAAAAWRHTLVVEGGLTANRERGKMTVNTFNSEELAEPHGFAHAVSATGGRTVYSSGTVGIDASGTLVGEASDYRAQAYQATINVYAALRAAGAGPADVVKFTMYVVDPTEENLNELYRGIGRASKELGGIATGTTLVGVTALSVPGAVYEVDAIAVVESGNGR